MTPLMILALFDRRVDGDDALLSLAKLRFEQAGLGAEIYASNAIELESLKRFRPAVAQPLVVHLPRNVNILEGGGRAFVLSMAEAARGSAHALVLHDQAEAASQPDAYQSAMARIASRLRELERPPCICVEYAVGLRPDQFHELVERLQPFDRVGACVDIGHVAIAEARRVFAASHAGTDVCSLRAWTPGLRDVMEDVRHAAEAGRWAAVELTARVGKLGKLMHMHLHDGHPLWAGSPWGVSDHVSFLEVIPLPFELDGRRGVDTMFGPSGLADVIDAARLQQAPVSFTLEIHPTPGRRPLDDAAGLFSHWRDLTNAERMNHWLATLRDNARLVRTSVNR